MRPCRNSIRWRGGARARAVLIVLRDGDKIIGPRFIQLLDGIEARGSIRAAASELGLGYRHALAWITRAESLVGQPLVNRHAGGAAGGGAVLTDKARRVSAAYRRVNSSIYRLVERAEREILDT
ncbi:MAG: winged helix-turn-helix domain-containing protein [Gemmatimonadaceae bacterium]